MKKYSIIIIFALLLGLLSLQFFRQNEAEPGLESHQPTEGLPAGDRQDTAPALTVGEEQPPQQEEEPEQASIKTLWEKGNFPERLQVADIDMPLVFEGQVSEELKQVILADINLVFGQTKSHGFYNVRPERSYEIPGHDEAFTASRGLIFNGRGYGVPGEFYDNFGEVIEFQGEKSVVVPAGLISAYEKAWEARKADPEKYESLESFITWLNTAPMEDLKANNPYWLFGYDGISEASSEEPAEVRARRKEIEEVRATLLTARTGGPLRVGHPSILEFTYVDQEVLEREKLTEYLPVGVTLADGKDIDENGVPRQQALFLYDGEKWHIAFAPAGT